MVVNITSFAFVFSFAITLLVSAVLVGTKNIHGRFSNDQGFGVQKFHIGSIPRIGGIAIAAGFFIGVMVLPKPMVGPVLLIGLAGIPALLIGLLEDVTKRISVRVRLFSTILSGLIFVLASGYALQNIGISAVNAVLVFPAISIGLTAFAIGGVANSINLIDGFNGLAIGTLVLISIAFALVGWRIGDGFVFGFALFLASIFSGLMVLNFPMGKIFLGDGGAYFSGYLVAVLAVMLPVRNPEISPWISLLILGYPITETVVSIARRSMSAGKKIGQPDSGHLHHKVYFNWSEQLQTLFGKHVSQNSVTSIVIWIIPLPALFFVIFAELTLKNALLALVFMLLVYGAMYLATMQGSTKKPTRLAKLKELHQK
ncbi:MAG: glycosyltransferase [Rhodobacteraceae bacterium]|nr:glycosyltransferase [Paracoccaceae bacterium]